MNKSFKFGFTLVEVLVAMTIVGVIAVFVIPPLIAGAQNKKHAASLGRSVELIETGCQMLVQDINDRMGGGMDGHYHITKDINDNTNGAANFYTDQIVDSIIYNSNLFEYTSEYFHLTPFTPEDVYIKSVKDFNGDTPSPSVDYIAKKFALSSKLGAYYGVSFLHNIGHNGYGESPEKGTYELIYIDVNGPSSPNRYGRDIFLFNLTDSCHMIPAGTNKVKNIISSIPLAEDGCKDNNIKNGLSCTARVVRDGYKIEYSK